MSRKIPLLFWVQFPILTALCQQPVTNQRLFDTIPFLPDHWTTRQSIFESQPVLPGRVIFLGNSITEMGNWKQLTGDSTVLNRGISGDITFGVLKRLGEITRREPADLFLLIGINDIGKDIPNAVIAENIGKIIQRIRAESPATRIYLQTLMPVNPHIPGFPQHYDKQAHILQTNRLLRELAGRLKVTLADLFPLFADKEGNLDKKYTRDGLHLDPDGDGYRIWVNFLRKKGWLH